MKFNALHSHMLLDLKRTYQKEALCFSLQIVPGIQNENAEVRNTAMQALGLCCYLSKDLLVTYIPLFMQVCTFHSSCRYVHSTLEYMFRSVCHYVCS